MGYLDLREKYTEFNYRKFDIKMVDDDLVINYFYDLLPDHTFKHTLRILKAPKNVDFSDIEDLVFNIGLVEMFSYWKLTSSPKIIIKSSSLDRFQIQWWEKLLLKGMGQYFYENRIDFTSKNFVEIVAKETENKGPILNVDGEKVLIPVGGGKDSAVTLELLGGKENSAFVLNETAASRGTIEKSSIKSKIKVVRQLDPKILTLNEEKYLNGHVPFSASLAFIGVLCAYLFDFKYLAFSNEKSSDEENTKYLGQKINHQYSKTLEFENDFREYNQKYLSNVEYFSFLRPLYEIQISKIFSKFDKYFDVIRSCNVGIKDNVWCESCPKCLSTYILLSPFIDTQKMKRIFSKNLVEEPKLSSLLSELIDENKIKPFECVGTKEELKKALNDSYQNLLDTWGSNNIPNKFVNILKENLNG